MPIGSCTRVVLLAAILVTLPTPAPAQVQRGTILGTVRDPSGAVLPGALVQLTSEVDAPREIASGDRGDYRFQDGTAGFCHDRVRHAGLQVGTWRHVATGERPRALQSR
jgi:hypothetical protein